MFRKRRRRGKVVMGCFILLLIGFVYGYMINDTQIPNKPNNGNNSNKNIGQSIENSLTEKNIGKQEQTKNIEGNEIRTQINQNSSIVDDNMKIRYKTYYKKTRDVLTKEESIPMNFIGKPLNELAAYFEQNYLDWSIREINDHTIELYRTIDQISPVHYIIKEKDGYIGIFQINDEGSVILLEQTDIGVSTLSDVDRQKLMEGIVVKGREAINQILEDYSS